MDKLLLKNKIKLAQQQYEAMRPSGLSRKVKQLVLAALMSQPCKIATTPLPLPTNPLYLSSPTTSYAPRYSVNFTTMNNNEEQDHLNALFKQKQVLRSRVRKALKGMDPILRSQEGNF